ncbi:CinA-like protein [Marmoricola endophyticus]|uniref:CinA-like protein n=1 Tax=Marmoricola endophyticus TaxID=2040280 RepID=A0A917BJ99_9ACTN|nr:competence/damage-inducible protein A [Marmoricola endophyticus]GGF44906.1 CinA-like protein [Marmoricola endophyticus]
MTRTDAAPSGPPRAAVVVTGTEVLTGRVTDRNGPFLAERLRQLGVDVGRVVVVGDRRDDLASALSYLLDEHDLVITSGGLGPTADDLTVEVVAAVQGRVVRHDEALEQRIRDRVAGIVRRRGWSTPTAVLEVGTRKQAMVPEGAHVLEPVGTAPGVVVTPASGEGTPVVVLPGPPGELQPMWAAAEADDLVRAVLDRGREIRQGTVRIWGPPEAELAALLRDLQEETGSPLDEQGLEITTCLRKGELEVVTRYAPAASPAYERLVAALHDRFGDQVFADDARSVDDVVAEALLARGETVATAESCTAGMLAARFADRPGSSAYLLGGLVTYANQAKVDLAGVPQQLLDSVGAVSAEVAEAMAVGARERVGSTYGIGVTGVAGPDGGTAGKPVGLVHVCLAGPSGTRPVELHLGGPRDEIRLRTTIAALHLLRRELED